MKTQNPLTSAVPVYSARAKRPAQNKANFPFIRSSVLYNCPELKLENCSDSDECQSSQIVWLCCENNRAQNVSRASQHRILCLSVLIWHQLMLMTSTTLLCSFKTALCMWRVSIWGAVWIHTDSCRDWSMRIHVNLCAPHSNWVLIEECFLWALVSTSARELEWCPPT